MPKKPTIQPIDFKSNYPYSIYLLVILPFTLILLTITYNWNFWALLTYLPILIVLFYVFFARFSARVEINSHSKLHIYYFFPWNKNTILDLKDFRCFDYARGFYDPFNDRRLGYLNLLRKCYDLIIFVNGHNYSKEFKVNLRIGDFKKIIDILDKQAKLVLVDLKSSDHIIW